MLNGKKTIFYNDNTDIELKDRVTKIMMEGSQPVKDIPKRIYHATPLTNYGSIMTDGLIPHSLFGEIYFCEKEKQCLKFIQKPLVVFEINTSDIDSNYIYYSRDHKKVKGQEFDVFTYYKKIDPKDIKDWKVYR